MRKDPSKNPNSIGNILRRLPSVTEADLERALKFHREYKDLMLGEVMVKIGIITRRQLDSAVMEQQRAHGKTLELLEYATQRTRAVASGIASLATLSTEVLIKLKGS